MCIRDSLLTLSPALVPDLFQGQERVKAMGYTGVTQGIGAGLLPMLGGLLASVTWYLPFLTAVIGLPIGLYLIIHLKTVQHPHRILISYSLKYYMASTLMYILS